MAAGVDGQVRGSERPSDHAPTWVEFTDAYQTKRHLIDDTPRIVLARKDPTAISPLTRASSTQMISSSYRRSLCQRLLTLVDNATLMTFATLVFTVNESRPPPEVPRCVSPR